MILPFKKLFEKNKKLQKTVKHCQKTSKIWEEKHTHMYIHNICIYIYNCKKLQKTIKKETSLKNVFKNCKTL